MWAPQVRAASCYTRQLIVREASSSPCCSLALPSLFLDHTADQTVRALHESKSVDEAASQKHTGFMKAGHVGCRDQNRVLRNAKLGELIQFRQNKQLPAC